MSLLLNLALSLLPAIPAFSTICNDREMIKEQDKGAHHEVKHESVFPYKVFRETLENGLRVIVIPMQSDGLVSYWTIVRTGSRDEVEKGVTGFAHFFEHMMFRGSEKYPAKEYDHIVSTMGADSNASTWDDKTVYHLSITKEDLPTVVEIESDRFQYLNYDELQFKTEAGAVYGEYRKGRTNPFEVIYEAIQEKAFDKHTYKHTTIGFEADIADMPNQFNYSKTFFKRFYRPENSIICVVGDVDPKATFDLIRTKYSPWKKGYVEPEVAQEPAQTAPRKVNVTFDGQTLPIVAVGFKGERFLPNDKNMLAGQLVGDLCFGETSPLYKKLVLEQQRVEQLATDFDHKRDPGLWIVFAIVKNPSDTAAVQAEIFAALGDICKNGVSAERLREVCSRQKYAFLSSLSTPSEVNERLAAYIALTGDLACIDQMFQTRDQLTPDDIKRAANLYFTPERSTAAILTSKVEGQGESTANGEAKPAAPVHNIILMPVAEDPNVAFKLWFKAGTQNEPKGKAGLASLTAAMLTEAGTKQLRYDEILSKLYPMAGSYGASVDKEMTVVSGSIHRDKVNDFYSLYTEAVLNPGFRNEDFERLRDRAINNIEKNLRYSSDEELGKAVLYSTIFKGTPYESYTDGAVESLRSITLDDVKSFYKQYYTKENVSIAIGGAYSPEVPERLGADLQRLPEGKVESVAAPAVSMPGGRHAEIISKPGPSTAISFGYPIDVHRGSKEYYALQIARAWLGEHRNSFSHLYQVIREKRGLNYGNYAYIEWFAQGGFRRMPPAGYGRRSQIFEVWIRPVPEKDAIFALRAALREVEKLSKTGLSQEEFNATKTFLSKYCIHYAETTEERLGYAIDDRFYGVDGHLKLFRKMLGELTREDVNAAIKKYIQTDNLTIAMITEHGDELAKKIASGAPSPILYTSEKPKEITDEDKLIEAFPLRIPAANIRVTGVDAVFQK
ncbi:MAG: M16 family metallopeptidase [Planctomycetota bacterium]